MTVVDAETPADASSTGRWLDRPAGVPVLLAVLVLLTRLPGLVTTRVFNTDEATLGVGGRALARGGSLYVDVIDRKPPVPFAVYSLVATSDLRLVRFVIGLAVFASALVAASEARRRWGAHAALVAGVVVVLAASALGARDAQAANFELFALLPITVAVVAAARGRAALAGVALAVAVLCKQPAAVTIVPVAWSWWQTSRWRGVLTGLAAGGVAGLVLTAPFGLGRVLEWALLGTGGYLSMAPADIGFAAVRLLALLGLCAGFWGGAWLLAVAARSAEPATTGRGETEHHARADPDLWLLLGASALGVVVGFRFFPHYLVQLIPALALLAGRGAARRPVWVRPALGWGIGASLVALGLAWGSVVVATPSYPKDLAAYARAHSVPRRDEILVWGNVPEVYWWADRQPAGGFTHTEFVTGHSGGRRPRPTTEADVPDPELYRRWIERLDDRPPALIFDTAAAHLRGGEYFPLSSFDAVARLVHDRYQRVATVDHVPVYRLKDQRPA